MQLDYAFICDYAEVKDKVNALGIGFNTIFARKMPTRHPHFSVVAQLRFSRAEIGNKNVRIHLINVDGVDVIPPINRQNEVTEPRPGSLDTTVRINIEFHNVEFKEYGSYSVKLSIEGNEIVDIPLRVVELPKAP